MLFGTDGIRGKAGFTPCTAEAALAMGRAAVRLAREQGGTTVLLARDTRPSGPMLMNACAAGVAAAGGKAVVYGVLPTSGVMAALREGLGEVGVVITASHNPAGDNGFKVLGKGGRKLTEADHRQFEHWLGLAPNEGPPGTIETQALTGIKHYQQALAKCCPPPDALAGLRIAVDLANGAAMATGRWLTDHYPSVHWTLLGTGEGVINDRVGSECPGALCEAVVAHGCYAGFAVDGDGDRGLLVDDAGRVVPGDALVWLLARGLRVSSLAVTVLSNAALEHHLPEVRIVRTPVGDRHLRLAMLRDAIPLAGEESGHVLFADAFEGGDGVVTALRALAIAAGQGALSKVIAPFKPYPRVTTKVPVRHRPLLASVAALAGACTDGEHQLGDKGRVLLRYSGTEPVLRVLVEGTNAAVVQSVANHITQVATKELS